jgi:hypothetical protein
MSAAAIGTNNLSVDELSRRTVQRRAIETMIWGMPAVNYDLMYRAMERLGGESNQIIYWSRLLDWKNQTLTPNPDAIYFMPFIDTKAAGPVVLEIPPADDGSITGSIDDCWQTALEDVGPAGADKGAGGKYLVLPPDYAGDAPSGFIALRSGTFRVYALLRSILKDGSRESVAKAVSYGKRIKVYPLSASPEQNPTVFIDAIDHMFDATIPYDVRFYHALDRIVQHEPWMARDKAMIDRLKSIGIEKGRGFDPDPITAQILVEAAQEGQAWIDALYEDVCANSFYEGSRWAFPASQDVVEGLQTDFVNPNAYPVDGRGVTYAFAFFSAKHLGGGSFYLMSIKDDAGCAFNGRNTYRLTVPPNAPVRQYWSATAYDRSTHALIHGMPWPSRSSQTPGIVGNDDGSIDVWFGPRVPEGQAANWIPTSPEGTFEVLFRFYAPEKALFDKTWILPNVRQIN